VTVSGTADGISRKHESGAAVHVDLSSPDRVTLGAMGAPWGRVFRSGNDDRTRPSDSRLSYGNRGDPTQRPQKER